MVDLEREIQARREQVRELEQKIAELQAAKADLELLERALAVLRGNGQARNANGNGHKLAAKNGEYRSSVDLAYAVLKEAGKPLLIDEIVERIQKRGVHVAKSSLVSSILRNSKGDRPRFRHPGKSLYAVAAHLATESAPHEPARESEGG